MPTHAPTASPAVSTDTHPGPLAGFTVLDLTTVIMGPFATAMLADLGAEVIKVEAPGGDMTRRIGASTHGDLGPLTLNLNRSKRSVVLDLGAPDDRAKLDELVASADVLVTNLRPRARERLGVTYERLSAVRPDIVLCTAQAYASASDRADDPAYDDIVQAASGFAMIPTLAGEEPAYTRSVIADKVSAFAINQAVLAALLHRSRSGEGQWVDVPMVDTMISFNLVEHLFEGTRLDSPSEIGWTRVLAPNRKPMLTRDERWVCLLPYSDDNWTDILRFIGRDDLVEDERVQSMNQRNAHMGFLLGVLHEAARERTLEEWLDFCRQARIPATELLDLRRAGEDAYVRERGILLASEHPHAGRYWALPLPVSFSGTPLSAPRPAPRLGEANSTLLP
jgi:crotonobetainyl-CoA:carnitine CoA-transferase CaiB-like acyl-CoA transferase